MAMMLVLGLLLGWLGRSVTDQRSPAAPAEQSPAAAPAETKPSTRAAPGKEWSEQTIAPQPSKTTPAIPNEAPPVISESPSGRPPSKAAASGQAASARPAATTGSLIVRSEPSRAPVIVNGKWRGRTPLTLDSLAFGKYVVRVVQPGYTVAREDVALSAGEPSRTLSFRLTRTAGVRPSAASAPARPGAAPPAPAGTTAGSIYVDSRPTGARVLIDGRAMGTTPARIPEIPIGSHLVRLELKDHRAWTTSTRVVAGQETRVTASLDRIQ